MDFVESAKGSQTWHGCQWMLGRQEHVVRLACIHEPSSKISKFVRKFRQSILAARNTQARKSSAIRIAGLLRSMFHVKIHLNSHNLQMMIF